MKRIEDVQAIVKYEGKLAEVVGIGEGRTIHMRFLGEPPCPTCGHHPGLDLLEHSPLFQRLVKPVDTVVG